MGARRQARELALQALYLGDITTLSAEEALNRVCYGAGPIAEGIRTFAEKLTHGARAHRDDIDGLIKRFAKNWEIGRMAVLDRNILRLGTFELLYQLDTPVSVVIDEAVEIAKLYSTEESGKFVNGILDRIKDERPADGSASEPTARTDEEG